MERCENCKHWMQHQEPKWKNGQCVKISESETCPPASILFADNEAWLVTAPYFGCTMFERKGGENEIVST